MSKKYNKLLKKNKKAVSLPINMVVMLIIGIMLFGLSLLIFQKFTNSSNDEMERLNAEIQTNLDSLSCDNNEYVCTSKISVKAGDIRTSSIIISNIGDSQEIFKINFNEISLSSSGCGNVEIFAPFTDISKNEIGAITLKAGKSAKIPFSVNTKMAQRDCTFITTITLNKTTSPPKNFGKTPLIITTS